VTNVRVVLLANVIGSRWRMSEWSKVPLVNVSVVQLVQESSDECYNGPTGD
jgi:hypothetical protein